MIMDAYIKFISTWKRTSVKSVFIILCNILEFKFYMNNFLK